MPRALITGVTGQDGAYLSELLLAKGYEVTGVARRRAGGGFDTAKLEALGVAGRVALREGDLTDLPALTRLLEETAPDEVYNLAAQSLVGASWRQPLLTSQVTAMGAVNLFEAVRVARPGARVFQACSSEMYGPTGDPKQTELTPLRPSSPYGVAKTFAFWMAGRYRIAFGLHASCGILFNHESPLRGREFVTRKITDGVARIALGLETELRLGDVEVRRDWGHARDHVRAMWLMLQQDEADDYVIATGRASSVRELCDIAFAYVGLHLDDHLVIDPALLRPVEVHTLQGDPFKAQARLGWRAETSLEALVAEMVDADLARLR